MNDEKLENSIMGKIKTGQVKLKSKYIFVAEKLGLGTAFALSVLLSILFFNLILFYLKETDNLKYLSFGKFGVFAFLESFPYLLVVAFILLIGLSGYLLTRSDVSYRKPFGYLAVGMVILIIIFGGILTYTNLGQNFERQARMGNETVKIFFRPLTDMHNNGIAGIIYEKGEDYLIVQTPQGLRRVEIGDVEDVSNIEKGKFIIAVGNGDKFNFIAQKIKVMNREDMPAINRGIDFKFKDFNQNDINSLPLDSLYFNETERSCIKQCFELKKQGPDCFKECHI
jgi:hypothetical protein